VLTQGSSSMVAVHSRKRVTLGFNVIIRFMHKRVVQKVKKLTILVVELL
jgi:hypothetical protein